MACRRSAGVELKENKAWAKILISGHSFARRFGEFLVHDEGVSPNFDLGTCEVNVSGRGGLKIGDWARNLGHAVASFGRPNLLLIMIGDNDISSECSAEEISSQILAFVPVIQGIRIGVPNVILCQLMPRFPSKTYRFDRRYNASAREVNRLLRQGAALLPNVLFWEHDFVSFPDENAAKYQQLQANFLADGVHLAPSGQFRMYKSLRKAVTHSRIFLRK